MKLLIRADADAKVGAGHVMRCLALAQACIDRGGSALFCAANLPLALHERLRMEGIPVVEIDATPGSRTDAAALAAVARAHSCDWVVADGYRFDHAYQLALRQNGLQVLILDDYGHASHYEANVILNQNLGAPASLYDNRAPGSELLIGSTFTLLRREFLRYRDWSRIIREQAKRILVTLGGGDSVNTSRKVIEALRLLTPEYSLNVCILVGPAALELGNILRSTQEAGHRVRVLTGTKHVPAIMAWADLAITAAGAACWELAFMKLPSIAIVRAANQQAQARELDQRGGLKNLGWHEDVRPEQIAFAIRSLIDSSTSRRAMAAKCSAIVDGRGAERVFAALEHYSDAIGRSAYASEERSGSSACRPV